MTKMGFVKTRFIFIYAIICILLLNLNMASSERPEWLITENELPDGWTYDTEVQINDRYIISLYPSRDIVFTVETLSLSNSSIAFDYVFEKYTDWNSTNQLDYVFYEDKVNKSWMDIGIIWEVKSPCCYSKGVLFSVDHIVIDIFGSQKSTWEQMNIIFEIQLYKLLLFLEKAIPTQLHIDIISLSSESVSGFVFNELLLGGSIFIIIIFKKKS